ncbi:MAG: GyrI-like domain-containing protein [Owenweeksia sp.]
MKHRIEDLKAMTLAGKKATMSFAQNRTGELWQSFMPLRSGIPGASSELYSAEVFPGTDFFRNFDLGRSFEKWAAVRVENTEFIPAEFNMLEVPGGLYAVFPYKGRPSEAAPVFQYIHTSWLPASGYILDDRPHFALMDERYKGEDADSEEEFWVPVRRK